MPTYALYGMTVHSNVTLAGLADAPAHAPCDIDVVLGGAEIATDDEPMTLYHAAGAHAMSEADVRRDAEGAFWFRYPDGNRFRLSANARQVAGWWGEASTLEDACTYLLGPVLGFALRRRGVLALHASAVLIDGRAVAFVGPGGAGKSTTAAYFATQGTPVLSDDIVAVHVSDGVATAYPSYKLLRLWDESERILFGTTGALPLLTPTWEKRAFPLGADHPFHDDPAPLSDVFILDARVKDDAAPRSAVLSPRAAFLQLVANTYANYLLDDDLRRQEVAALDALVGACRVHRLVPHVDAARLPALADVVWRAVRAS